MSGMAEPYARFLITHALGAVGCYFCIQSLLHVRGDGKVLPLLALLGGLAFAWSRRRQPPQVRDGIVASLCAPVAVIFAYQSCLSAAATHYFRLPDATNAIFLIMLGWSSILFLSARKGRYWKTLSGVLTFLLLSGPVAFGLALSRGF